jgi:hypothetical protein
MARDERPHLSDQTHRTVDEEGSIERIKKRGMAATRAEPQTPPPHTTIQRRLRQICRLKKIGRESESELLVRQEDRVVCQYDGERVGQ